MPVLNHIHTYFKFKGRPGFWRCGAPDCSLVIEQDLIKNKLSLCTQCGQQMILTREDLRRAAPRCLDCSNTKRAVAKRKAQELTRYLGTEAFDPLNVYQTQHTSETEELEEEDFEL